MLVSLAMEMERFCPSCGREASLDREITLGSYHYDFCGQCGAGALREHLAPHDAAKLYDAGYFEQGNHSGYIDYLADEAVHRKNARLRLRHIARYAFDAPPRSGARLLELGCAAGFFLDEAAKAGFSVRGVDVSPWAREKARSRLGEDAAVTAQLSEGFLDFAPVDLVCMFQVLEHVPHPLETLQEARSHISKNGRLVIETWNCESATARRSGRRWQQLSPPSVIHLFSQRAMGELLGRAGFRLVSYRRFSKWLSLGWGLALAADKLGLPGALSPLWKNRLSHFLTMPYLLDDLVMVVAEPG